MSARWLLLIHRCLNFIVTAILGIGLLGTLSSCSDSGSNSVQLTPSEQATNSQNSVRPCSIVVGRLNGADGGLFAAVESGDSVRVQRAIDEGAQVNATDVLKRTPLAVASFCNRPEIVSPNISRNRAN